jgi:hypothetical protein
MARGVYFLSSVIAVVLGIVQAATAIQLTPSQGGGPTPQQLAEEMADPQSGVDVAPGSASRNINNSFLGNPPSDLRAMGIFTNGNTTPGTQFVNAGVSGTYAGGISINSGVCLSTGLVSDSLQTAQPNLGFGVEGPNNGDGEGIFINSQGVSENHTGEVSTQLGLPVDQDFADLVFPNATPGGGDATVLSFDVEISQPAERFASSRKYIYSLKQPAARDKPARRAAAKLISRCIYLFDYSGRIDVASANLHRPYVASITARSPNLRAALNRDNVRAFHKSKMGPSPPK